MEALALYLFSIERGEQSKLLNINNYANDIERVIILYGRTKQKEFLIQFLEEKLKKYPDFRDAKDWAVRLTKLTSTGQIKTTPILPSDILPQKASFPTLGKKISDFKKSMPVFNFYFDRAEGSDTFTYNHNVPLDLFNKLRQYREAFETIKSLAKIAENEGDYKKAIEAYEKLIIEECEDPEPYKRLIIIYSKLKWKAEEKRTIERAISFFTTLKETQLDYTLNLAQKYGMKTKALEYINQDKKIFYYGGAFELYNPQTNRLSKWNERLKKL
jgi:tetratricopeptide (TPR) repeat protein